MTPLVSVVMATYNRSNLLPFSIGSLQKQTVGNWELIVVGDACTDDTEQVVRGLNDERITFVNLPDNFGEQSGPNNAGLALARANTIAFLNHDDLWWPDHLETGLAKLEETGAELVYSWSAVVYPRGTATLAGLSRDGSYQPRMVIGASSWIFRRDLYVRLGGWRPAKVLVNMPSQDWLFHAWRMGGRMVSTGHLTCLFLYSGARKGSYSDRASDEHRIVSERMVSQDYRYSLLEQGMADWLVKQPGDTVYRSLRALAETVFMALLVFLRISPVEYSLSRRYGGRGAFLRHLRKVRGLAPKEGL